MIYLGLNNQQKTAVVSDYIAAHGIRKVFALAPEKFRTEFSSLLVEHLEYKQIIEYKPFYRLLQEIDQSTLVIINECMRTQNRYDLTYNCIRNYLNQTGHQIIFQYFPFISTVEDFMILFDFDTRSRWKREAFKPALLPQAKIQVQRRDIQITPETILVSEKDKARYQVEKERLIKNIGLKDPHTIPRNLYLMSGKAKLANIDLAQVYIGRNNRFKVERMRTYKENDYQDRYTVFEFCHNHIDFADFAALSKQQEFTAMTTDLKVDQWYLARYQEWAQRLSDAYAVL